jgi:DNA-directed RNA polymerase sigma subunit (sigma70/sigma32)
MGLKEIRLERGLTQEKLAMAIGVNVVAITQIETGCRRAVLRNMKVTALAEKCCKFLGLRVQDIWLDQLMDCLPDDTPSLPESDCSIYQVSIEDNPETILMKKEMQHIITKLLLCLTPREETVIRMRIYHDKKLEEVGVLLGRSRERIRQIEAKAFRKMRTLITRTGRIEAPVIFEWFHTSQPTHIRPKFPVLD